MPSEWLGQAANKRHHPLPSLVANPLLWFAPPKRRGIFCGAHSMTFGTRGPVPFGPIRT
jgi:hypothetical protein